MSRSEDTIEVDAPAQRTWEVVSDPRYLPLVDPTSTVRLLSGEWTSVGSRHHVVHRVGRSVVDSVHEITRAESPHLVEERATSRWSVVTGSAEVRRIGDDRSALIVRHDVEWGDSFSALVARILYPLAGPPARRRLLKAIARVAESTDVPSADDEPHLGQER